MIELTVAQIAASTGGRVIWPEGTGAPTGRQPETAVVTTVVIDSRDAAPGALFVALPGEHVDGHDYVAGALERGAATALVARPVAGVAGPLVLVPDVQHALGELARVVLATLRAEREVMVVAITGSAGKTSTKDLLSRLLAPLGPLVAPVGSFNNEIGLPLTVLRADRDTVALVLEMGADAPGNLTYLTGIAPPDIAVVLMVGSAHLAGFGDRDGIAAAKSELVQGLRSHGVAVLNADDPRVAAMAPLASGERVLTFGSTTPGADVRATGIGLDEGGHATFTLRTARGAADVTLAMVGAHHVTNALAAATVALELGRPLAEVAAVLAETGPLSPHRMHVSTVAGAVSLIDDAYNANPDSMRAGLDALVAMAGPGRRSIAVLGEMLELGDTGPAEHEAIGRYAHQRGVDRLVVIGDGAGPIAAGAIAAGATAAVVSTFGTVDEAIEALGAELRHGDVVLVKSSKGAGLARLADRLTELAEVQP
ncbi:UDP-N-acetylmuramoyl-tripeptide--D-alanyl-D-alanine ligase [Occultella gossypii]|uniref:UDP-N-acetylmuramoyl-tripeptide--D-alanyl-D-alanine ligase n=1 Tax=Occultella gossypii TaxID=2800820 RepID=A0ABS7SFW5_9MICO|nr:UDP-N-acetylmuramoyl-tripeptide--D-alanyl-D-alanine ligase [Occultella gossypii]MBZ2199249.1 UDP-N-acetylmuramoyl-tripeptide--D-alanyl-D-alanine ligase [Occultella gossypii]